MGQIGVSPFSEIAEFLGKDIFLEVNHFMELLRHEDERGLVLSLAAFSDEALARLIQAYLREGEAVRKLTTGFNAPLGTFSSRILMAHALGLISDEQKSDFDYLRKIRNEFAHNWEGVSFATKKVADLASNIRPINLKDFTDQPLHFQLQAKITMTLVVLEVATHTTKRLEDKSVKPTIPSG